MATPAPTIPPTREFTLVGIAYGLYAFGLLVFWPALAGVVIAYIRRDDAAGTILESHYRWLIRTFWWWVCLFALIIGLMVMSIVPAAIHMGVHTERGTSVNIPWSLIGTAITGGIALAIVWCWVVYRLIRGTIRLSDGRPAP